MIGFGLPAWIDVTRFLNASETKETGSVLWLRPDGRCPRCGHRMATDKAHVVRKGMGGTKKAGPMIGLCRECHTGPTGMDRCEDWCVLLDRVSEVPCIVEKNGAIKPTGAVRY